MKEQSALHPRSIFLFILLFCFSCNGLTVDNSLSPPTIGKPIYNCSEIIFFGGADRDAKIRVYVNGNKVKEVSTWMGWGSVRLPNPLSAGDVVSAAQIIDHRISVRTREAVTVEIIPADKLINGEKLQTPIIKAPLYECQKCIIVENILHGATVRLAENGIEIKDNITPHNIIRFGMPELKVDDEYEAWQEMCMKSRGYTSDHSPREKVRTKPESLPTPEIHEPIVAGNDACRVDNLFLGARVIIFAVDGSGETQVGGGTALGSATIYHIDPPFDLDCTYYAQQYLCDLGSDPSEKTTPEKEPPAPVIHEPICDGSFMVTICNTAVMSTIKVYVNSSQVAQAAGNGECVRLAIGDAFTFGTGQKVEAKQYISGSASPVSNTVIVKQDGAPPYNPSYWNDPDIVKCNNCYNYGCNIRTDTYAQPGYAHNVSHSTTCPTVSTAALADGLESSHVEKRCRDCSHIVALVIAPGEDYHWYRQDDNGLWSHKMASWPAGNLDGSDNIITNPESADRRVFNGQDFIRDYSIFCGYFCVNKDNVIIDGSGSCD